MVYKILLGVVVLLSFGSTFVLLNNSRRNNNYLQVVLSLLLLISNVGYFFLASSTGIGEALLANALSYIGGIFLPMMVMFILAEFSKSTLPQWFVYSISAVNVILFFAIAMTGRYPFFYDNIRLLIYPDGVADFMFTPANFYYARFIVVGIELALSGFFTVLAFIGKKKASFKTMFTYVGVFLAGFLVYFLEKVFVSRYEMVPFFYMVCSIGLVYFSTRSMLYDVTLSVQEKMEELSPYGYIVFDRNMNYIGSNVAAEKLFPEIKDAKIDKPIEPENYALKSIVSWVKEKAAPFDIHERNSLKRLGLNDRNPEERRYLDCELSYIHFGSSHHVLGYLVEMEDRTQHYEDHLRNDNLIHKARREIARSNNEVNKSLQKMKSLQESTILGMASMIESRDNSTGGHINRTSSCVSLFVDTLQTMPAYGDKSENYWYAVKQAAVLHDLGKIAVDDYILRKEAGLTDEEYAKMKGHAEVGAVIVEKVLKEVDDKEFVAVAVNVAHYHHEKYNGKGYPDGLKGKNIPLEARIMALADVFDALASERAYKKPMPYDQCFKLIEEEAGTHFDPKLVDVFLKLRPQIIDLYNSFEGTDKHR
ncbi:MAG: HD domain-containing protein [Clostridiales bacterium]|nr:HD domain-containing protein [Clostridiales bacterium]